MAAKTKLVVTLALFVTATLVLVSLHVFVPDYNNLQEIASKLVQGNSSSSAEQWNVFKLFPEISKYSGYPESGNNTGTEFWKYIIPSFSCPSRLLVRVGGDNDGGKWTCGLQTVGKSKNQDCLVYSFGVKDDSSFEAEVLATTYCSVYAYDPAVNSIGRPLRESNPRVHFERLGIGGEDTAELRTLGTLLRLNGHYDRVVTMLKVDVEGAEFSALENILDEFPDTLPFAQLMVEIHIPNWEEVPRKGDRLMQIFRKLEKRGLWLFSKEHNPRCYYCTELSFINLHFLHLFIEEGHLSPNLFPRIKFGLSK